MREFLERHLQRVHVSALINCFFSESKCFDSFRLYLKPISAVYLLNFKWIIKLPGNDLEIILQQQQISLHFEIKQKHLTAIYLQYLSQYFRTSNYLNQ